MARADLVLDLSWRRRWLWALLWPALWLGVRMRWCRPVNALLWLMPVDVRVGRRVQRHRLHLDGTGSLGWASG